MNSNKPNTHPPKLVVTFLQWFCRPDMLEDVEGDLMEFFAHRLELYGPRKAKLLYARDVLLLLRPKMIRQFRVPLSGILFQNNMKMAFRHVSRHKGYAAINIGGLSLGMSVAILIGLWLWDEVSYNTYHENYEKIAQVMQNQTFDDVQTWRGQARQLGPELRTNYADHFTYITMSSGPERTTLRSGDIVLTKRGVYMEPDAPHMLSLDMLRGTRDGLQDKLAVLISASTAEALFGNDDPLNKLITVEDEALKVTGVYRDLPDNSDFAGLQFIATWELYESFLPEWVGWGNSWFRTYVQIAEDTDMAVVSERIKLAKWNNLEAGQELKPELFLHPMSKWHLYSDFENGVSVGGRITYVILFGCIGSFVLLLACINFMNFSTARSEKRAREVGIRKAIGSYRSNLISQFLNESLVIAFFSLVLALVLVQVALPMFNIVADKQVSILWNSPVFWSVLVGFTLITGILAGSYPAFFLSSFQPSKVLKNSSGRHSSLPRKVLVVIQITVSITLVIGTLIVFQQIQFAKNRPIGYDQSNLITVPIKSGNIHEHYHAFREALLATGQVEAVAKSESPITQTYTTNSGLTWQGKNPDLHAEFVTVRVTHDFGKTIGWEILQGRDFSTDIASDSTAIVINEACVDYLGVENPIGTILDWGDNEQLHIIGVARNMVTQSPYSTIRQMFFFIDYDRTGYANIRLKQGVSIPRAITDVESVYRQFDEANPFEFEFADQQHASKFGGVVRIGRLSLFFTILAIVISCMGLFGMASFVAEQRTREIGIRKVLGASVANLWSLVSRDFVLLVVVSCMIAIPISYTFLYDWLKQFDYHTDISVFVFVFTAVGSLLVTLLTVSFQCIGVALSNPVQSLRAD